MQTDPDHDVPCSEACDSYKELLTMTPRFTLEDVCTCDDCKEPMIPNLSTNEDGTGYLWSCTTPGCRDFTGHEIEAEDLIACGCPVWLAKRLAGLSDALLEIHDEQENFDLLKGAGQ